MTATIHIAGPMIRNQQHCVRCGTLLGDCRVRGRDIPEDAHIPFLVWRREYVEGAHVELGPHHAAMVLGAQPTCVEVRVSVTSAELLAEGRY